MEQNKFVTYVKNFEWRVRKFVVVQWGWESEGGGQRFSSESDNTHAVTW